MHPIKTCPMSNYPAQALPKLLLRSGSDAGPCTIIGSGAGDANAGGGIGAGAGANAGGGGAGVLEQEEERRS